MEASSLFFFFSFFLFFRKMVGRKRGLSLPLPSFPDIAFFFFPQALAWQNSSPAAHSSSSFPPPLTRLPFFPSEKGELVGVFFPSPFVILFLPPRQSGKKRRCAALLLLLSPRVLLLFFPRSGKNSSRSPPFFLFFRLFSSGVAYQVALSSLALLSGFPDIAVKPYPPCLLFSPLSVAFFFSSRSAVGNGSELAPTLSARRRIPFRERLNSLLLSFLPSSASRFPLVEGEEAISPPLFFFPPKEAGCFPPKEILLPGETDIMHFLFSPPPPVFFLLFYSAPRNFSFFSNPGEHPFPLILSLPP